MDAGSRLIRLGKCAERSSLFLVAEGVAVADLNSATDAVSSQNDRLSVSMLAAAFLCKTASHAKTEEVDHSAS